MVVLFNFLWSDTAWQQHCLYLSQHLIVLHVVHLVGIDLSFQSILIEFTTDVDQQCGGAGINVTAQRDAANIPRNMDAVAQDHANK